MTAKMRIALGISALILVPLSACDAGGGTDDEAVASVASAVRAGDAKMDAYLRVALDRGITRSNVHKAFPDRLARARVEGDVVVVDVLIAASPAALPKLSAIGVRVRTVTSGGRMTATVPLNRLRAVAALSEVTRIEAAKSVRMYNDLSNGLVTTAAGTWAGMNNSRATGGAGIIVGVIDSGLDWTHKDFIRNDEVPGAQLESRILHYWDQSDTDDDRTPADLGLTYGHEYVKADFDDALNHFDNSWDPGTNWFGPVDQVGYPIKSFARDTDGHGTHVTGTAAGDGSGSGMQGGAPLADIIFVKFDFDGDRNTDAAIIDGVNFIFSRAAALGRPAVINMSLGSDYGPHDGSTLEERGIDDLAGKGRVVVIAAGNPGANNWSRSLRWGYALHGSGTLSTESFTFRFPTYTPDAAGGDYVFFDVWYPGGTNKCRVKVTTPSGKVYPPAGTQYKNYWVTGSSYTGFNTTEGGILVQNGGDPFGFGATNGLHDAYIEISDYWNVDPAAGTWSIQLVAADTKSKCIGTFHAWYGASNSVVHGWQAEPVRNPTPRFAGRESDNKVTVGTPATANEVIAVAAYQTREAWQFAYGTECLPESEGVQTYSAYPIHYYDPVDAGELVFFSGRGPRRDGVLKPEIATPGVGIASSFSHFVRKVEWPERCVSYWDGGPYHFGTNRVTPNLEATVIQGTSMACPNMTGATALLLERKGDLDDKCLRKILAVTARHDAATDTYLSVANSEFSDTDTAAGPNKANFDWGYGKMDVDAALAALASYPACTGACTTDAQCGTGKRCQVATDPCGCNTCVTAPACFPAGTSCTANSQCCSLSCAGRAGKKTCK
ncbi:MAG: S8 family serine peptidase [Deltaproteobacteria bacterium]|nr:S8 family serine peptidase [Deltaproteobacteria bacterium]